MRFFINAEHKRTKTNCSGIAKSRLFHFPLRSYFFYVDYGAMKIIFVELQIATHERLHCRKSQKLCWNFIKMYTQRSFVLGKTFLKTMVMNLRNIFVDQRRVMKNPQTVMKLQNNGFTFLSFTVKTFYDSYSYPTNSFNAYIHTTTVFLIYCFLLRPWWSCKITIF